VRKEAASVDGIAIDTRIDGADQEQTFQAVALRIVGKHVEWVDQTGDLHSTTWDPFEEQICINLPKEEA